MSFLSKTGKRINEQFMIYTRNNLLSYRNHLDIKGLEETLVILAEWDECMKIHADMMNEMDIPVTAPARKKQAELEALGNRCRKLVEEEMASREAVRKYQEAKNKVSENENQASKVL